MEVSEKFLQTALDGIQDCVNIVDRDFKIIFMNETASRVAGKKRQLLLGNKCYAELWKESVPCENCVTGKVFETAMPQQTVKWEPGLDGKKFCIEKFAFPILDKNGNVEYAVEIFRDVTDRKLLEEEREQQRLELGRRVRELRHAYEELKSTQSQLLQAEKMASMGILASSIAHELDTPLTTISGYCELLTEDIQDERLLGRVKIISEQMEHLSDKILAKELGSTVATVRRIRIKEAKKYANRERVKVRFKLGNMCSLPYKRETFDVIFCLWSAFNELLTVKEQIAAIKSMMRVLKSGGWALLEGALPPTKGAFKRIITHDIGGIPTKHYFHDKKSFTTLMKRAGVKRFKIYIAPFAGRKRLFLWFKKAT